MPDDPSAPDPVEDLFGPVIFRYTAEDAVRDGVLVPSGFLERGSHRIPIYFTATLAADGYDDADRRRDLIERGIHLLRRHDAEDSEYLRLRVIEKDRIWVTLTGEGLTYMTPEDY